MALTKEQVDRLLASVSTKQKADAVGIKLDSREQKQMAKSIDAANIVRGINEPRTQTYNSPVIQSTFAGQPKTIEESGLTANGFEFDSSQAAALKTLIHGRHVCLIGAAGSGKTTMVKHALAKLIYGGDDVPKHYGIRQLDGDQGPSIALCAFTGIASQVIKDMLPAWLAPACKTIHQLLEYKPADEEGKMFVPTRNSMNKLDHDIIVIDEASMLGLDLWHNVVDALKPHTRIILIGDLNQLKPVADATMFAYALSAGIDGLEGWSIAELTTIHRQKEAADNRIVDAAHNVLNGKKPVWDDMGDPTWRIIGYEIPVKAGDAQAQIVGAVRALMQTQIPNEDRMIFDPYADLILCAGNGYEENDSSAFVQQAPLNEVLSRIIEPPSAEHPVYLIDAGRDTKKFAVGHRVMATKNESPTVKDRVTNGMRGRIVLIEPNKNWSGNRAMFGTEAEVLAWRKEQAKLAMARMRGGQGEVTQTPFTFDIASFDTSRLDAKDEKTERQSSHRVTVRFANGATRTYATAADVHGIQLAYASTVHKAQGSQADTVIVIVHQAVKQQLSREWFYTAITRARRRVVVLYTTQGLSVAVNRQQIFGANLKEKVQRYRETMENGRAFVRLTATTSNLFDAADDAKRSVASDFNDSEGESHDAEIV